MQASVVGLGCWQFGSSQWDPGERGASTAGAIVQRALDLGINLFDTAELYGNGRSEQILASALGERRDEAIIASKVSPHHLSRRGVVTAAERSLRRLESENIDLYQVHWPNRFLPLSGTMAGMRDLIEAGKIRHAGVSNFSLDLWQRAERALGRPVVANQVSFHLLDRRPIEALLPWAKQQGHVIIAYSPLAQGVLGGRYGKGRLPRDFRASNPLFTDVSFERIAPLLDLQRAVARRHGATPAQVALAWLLHLPQVVVIPGARSVEQLEENAAAADLALTNEEWRELDSAASAAQPPRRRPGLRRAVTWLLGA